MLLVFFRIEYTARNVFIVNIQKFIFVYIYHLEKFRRIKTMRYWLKKYGSE